MEIRVRVLSFVLAAAFLALSPASPARADVWVLEVLTLRPDAPPHQADAYVGALGLVARRHGGLRVDGARDVATRPGDPSGRLVGLWRFRDVASLDSLLADPAYRSLAGLHERTFDPVSSRDLARVRALAGPGE